MKTFLSCLFFLFATSAFCQQKDYLVKQNGDTLYGYIELRNKIFRISNTSTPTIELAAKDVAKLHSQYFKGTIVVPCKLHTYTDDLQELQSYRFVNAELDTVMLLDEVYSTPKMNLYWGTDNFKRQYYFYKTPTDVLPVQLYINYATGGGQTAAAEKGLTGGSSVLHIEVQKGYVNQLRLIMGDCRRIGEGDWEILDYRLYSLKGVIKKFNKCK